MRTHEQVHCVSRLFESNERNNNEQRKMKNKNPFSELMEFDDKFVHFFVEKKAMTHSPLT